MPISRGWAQTPFWLGASAVALLAGVKYSNEKSTEGSVGTMPGGSDIEVLPQDGSIVCCDVYELLDHSGIWLDGNIIELNGNGLIRGVSPQRFLQERSGDKIYVACDVMQQPFFEKTIAKRASERLFEYSEYDVINNNCHNFVWQCIAGEMNEVTRFSELNKKMAERFKQIIHWQPCLL